MKRIIAIIPARSGSKGLPGKNTLNLAGKPLISWTIKASLKSKYITETVLSSDSDKILEIAQDYGSNTLKRPIEFAQDSSSSESVIEHAILSMKEKNQEFDYLVLLQPTSPLRDENDIDAAFDLLFEKDASALISVCEVDNKILKAFKQTKDGYMEAISDKRYPFMRRQDLPKTYMSNGAIYIIKVDEFMNNKKLLTDKTISFEMNKIKSLDVDTQEDLQEIKNILT